MDPILAIMICNIVFRSIFFGLNLWVLLKWPEPCASDDWYKTAMICMCVSYGVSLLDAVVRLIRFAILAVAMGCYGLFVLVLMFVVYYKSPECAELTPEYHLWFKIHIIIIYVAIGLAVCLCATAAITGKRPSGGNFYVKMH